MIRTAQSHLSVAARSHPGMSGKNNEDRYAVSAFQLEKPRRTPALFAVISDGIGGHRAGEVAAEIAVETISQGVARSSGANPIATLQETIQQASQEIYRQAEADSARQGMGATCACAWIIGNRLYTAALGDSRIYLMRKGSIRQISRDHTWVQEAIERGIIRPEEAREHPNAHVIRRYLGGPRPPKVDFGLRVKNKESDRAAAGNQGLELKTGDRLLLCSDGLTDLVDDADILACFQKYSLDGATQALIEQANQRGGHDNITLVAIEAPRGAFREPHTGLRLFMVAAGVLLMAAVITFWWFFGPQTVSNLLGGGGGPVANPTINFSITSAPLPTLQPSTGATAALPGAATATLLPAIESSTSAPAIVATLGPQATAYPGAPSGPTLAPSPLATGGPTLTPWPTNTRTP